MTTTSLDYYDGPEILDELEDALRQAGLDPDALDVDDLTALDEFHARGRAATVALAELAGVRGGERVLDVGAGIGGPARFLAARYGADVTALDATRRFSAACERLTRSARLADRVHTVCGDALALPFPDASFDIAWTQALAQNIAAKERLVAELVRVVRPGGRVAMFELLAGPGGPIHFPVPWADRPDQSWLITATELRDLLESGPSRAGGLERDRGGARVDRGRRSTSAGPPVTRAPHAHARLRGPHGHDGQKRRRAAGRAGPSGRRRLTTAPCPALGSPVATGRSPRLRSVSVSVLAPAVAAWGAVRPGGPHSRACRCSRGRRPSGSDSEATGPLAALLQRHRSGVGGRLTRILLRHACRLQRP